jgi:hypothetical protein
MSTDRTCLLDRQTADRLARICGMFGSYFDGERAAAAAKADAILKELGLTWRDIIVAPPLVPYEPATGWQRMAQFCAARRWHLNERERGFINSVLTWRGEPTEKMQCWLVDIYQRLRGAGR